MDNQSIYVTVELEKFTLQAAECQTDLEKLLFTMKAIDKEFTVGEQVQYPQFWTEEWLRFAISELDTRAMSPEKRMVYEMTLSNNAEAVRQEKEKIDMAKIEGKIEGKIEIILALADTRMEIEQIALISKIPSEEVERLISQHRKGR